MNGEMSIVKQTTKKKKIVTPKRKKKHLYDKIWNLVAIVATQSRLNLVKDELIYILIHL